MKSRLTFLRTDPGGINSMFSVSNIPWFSRVWTVQEVAFARKPIAFCGRDTARFRDLSEMLLLSLLEDFGSSGTLLRHKTQQMLFRYYYSQWTTWISNVDVRRDLVHSMAAVASHGATEPKDKIFAVRGLLEKLGITLPLPDYADSLANVYWQATKIFLLHYPEILYLVTGYPSRRLENAASWVPDFSDQSSRFAISPDWDILKDRDSSHVAKFPGQSGRFLQLEGQVLDTICGVSRLKIWDTKASEPLYELELLKMIELHSSHILEALQEWAFMAQLNQFHVNGTSWQDAFLSTIASTSILKSAAQGRIAVQAKEWCSVLLLDAGGAGLRVLDKHWPPTASWTQHSIQPAVKQFRTATIAIQNGISREYISLLLAINFYRDTTKILLALSDNIFFITDRGYMGIGPSSIKNGDKVICIPGLKLPLVVRPIGEGFTLVSAAYFHGIPRTIWDKTAQLSTFILE
jgi:hypothetical protein